MDSISIITMVGLLALNVPFYLSLILGYSGAIVNGWAIMLDTICITVLFIASVILLLRELRDEEKHTIESNSFHIKIGLVSCPVIINLILFGASFNSKEFEIFFSAVSIIQYVFNLGYHIAAFVIMFRITLAENIFTLPWLPIYVAWQFLLNPVIIFSSIEFAKTNDNSDIVIASMASIFSFFAYAIYFLSVLSINEDIANEARAQTARHLKNSKTKEAGQDQQEQQDMQEKTMEKELAQSLAVERALEMELQVKKHQNPKQHVHQHQHQHQQRQQQPPLYIQVDTPSTVLRHKSESGSDNHHNNNDRVTVDVIIAPPDSINVQHDPTESNKL